MICYICLEKRGDYIKKLINWSLLSDEKVVINNKKIECEYKDKEFIKYKEGNDTINLVDIKKKLYKRENDEFIFKIDFEKSVFSYILKENNIKLEDKIICYFIQNSNEYILKYTLDEEEKKIIIQVL